MYAYGLIGNCQIAALVGNTGSLEWLCLPEPDSEPVFGRLLDPAGGHFAIVSPDGPGNYTFKQEYRQNTNILVTKCEDPSGNGYQITDFCPRFVQFGRVYRPVALFRIVEPLGEAPAICVHFQPVTGWAKKIPESARGNSHIRYDIRGEVLRLTTNMPLSYVTDPTPFHLHGKIYFALTWGVGLEGDLVEVSERFLGETTRYWENWVKHCSIPSLYQRETIRSALALKLHCYEDTGAILASITTSLSEEEGGVRNWDYRYCWLRDAYFVLSAFHSLSHFEEMEGFLKFLLNVVAGLEGSEKSLRPVYNLRHRLPLPEVEMGNWNGYAASKPVRVGNQAAEHVQNDVYGEMILTLAPIFFDERFRSLRDGAYERLLGELGKLCAASIGKPDNGLWEIREKMQEHSFTNLMCWAGLERLHRIQNMGFLKGRSIDGANVLARAESAIRKAVVGGSLRNGPSDETFDAALVQLPILGFPDTGLCRATVEQVMENLVWPNRPDRSFFFRYRRQDDFGKPQSIFVACSFWIVQALTRLQLSDQAREIMDKTLLAANPLGLLSEHYEPDNRIQRGNFPQTYSHVGLINAAFAVSPPWSQVL